MNNSFSEISKTNQVEVYASKIQQGEHFDDYTHLLPLVSKERQERIRQFRFDRDKLRCLKAELILRKVLTENYGMQAKKVSFKTNEYGKPYLEENIIYFNLSHSGNWVVCAISPKEVGIDIEEIQHVDFSIANKYFSEMETKTLNNLAEENKLDYFFEIWTLKESFIKAVGKGLAIPLDSFIIKKQNSVELISKQYSGYYFKEYKIDTGYKLSVCSTIRTFSGNIIFL